MAMLFMDGCDYSSNGAEPTYRGWVGGANQILPTSGRFGGGCMKLTGSINITIINATLTKMAASDTVYFFTCMQIASGYDYYSADDILLGLVVEGMDQVFNSYFSFALTMTNSYYLKAVAANGNVSSGSTIATSTKTLPTDQWITVEGRVKLAHTATGEVQIWVNGEEYINETSVITTNNTGSKYATSIGLGGGKIDVKFDDVAVWDDTGTDNNSRKGDLRIWTIRPDSDDTTNFTPDSGTTNYTQVDETGISGTDYVYATATGLLDLYGMGTLGAATSPDAVQAVTACRRWSGYVELENVLVSGTATATSASPPAINASYSGLVDINETDPNTSTKWTISGVNAAKSGVRSK